MRTLFMFLVLVLVLMPVNLFAQDDHPQDEREGGIVDVPIQVDSDTDAEAEAKAEDVDAETNAGAEAKAEDKAEGKEGSSSEAKEEEAPSAFKAKELDELQAGKLRSYELFWLDNDIEDRLEYENELVRAEYIESVEERAAHWIDQIVEGEVVEFHDRDGNIDDNPDSRKLFTERVIEIMTESMDDATAHGMLAYPYLSDIDEDEAREAEEGSVDAVKELLVDMVQQGRLTIHQAPKADRTKTAMQGFSRIAQ
jgi:hypothetical protein